MTNSQELGANLAISMEVEGISFGLALIGVVQDIG
jgi:hypothetical protein